MLDSASKPNRGDHFCILAICFSVMGCRGHVSQPPRTPAASAPPPTRQQRPEPTFRGVATYEDGAPAAGALIAITHMASEKEAALVVAGQDGHFGVSLEAGAYALAITTAQGFGWVEELQVPSLDATLTLSRRCQPVRGHAKGAGDGAQIAVTRISNSTGDIFIGNVRQDGSFRLCLPEGHYRVDLRGSVVSLSTGLDLAGEPANSVDLELEGFSTELIEQSPRNSTHIRAGLDGLVDDIIRRDARLIGLGEATHGTAELTSSRGTLTLELIRRADVRLVLFEFDGIVATAIDDYVMGADVDLPKAVAALGFWITDTYELLHFFEELRTHNATARNKVHVWGVDVQQTEAAASLLVANARSLGLTAGEKTLLEVVAKDRGRPVREITAERRAALDALLARLATPRGTKDKDLRIAVAARSLIVQVGYLDGDVAGLYGARRDAGMASLASFLLARAATPRACIWAHAGHVARETEAGAPSMGTHLADVASNRYYPVGFYVYEGSVRAWDLAGEIGVISHPIPRAPDYTLEGAVMSATGSPEIAWLPVSAFSPALRTWTRVPRYVREVGALYGEVADLMTLRDVPGAFDAIAVIKTGHDSSPTPTGVRKVEN